MLSVYLLSQAGVLRVVPEALQVGRLPAGAAGADHQVAAELEDQCDQRRIVRRWRRRRCARRSAVRAAGEVPRSSVTRRKSAWWSAMCSARSVSKLFPRAPPAPPRSAHAGRPRHPVGLEIGGAGQDQGGGVGAGDQQFAVSQFLFAARTVAFRRASYRMAESATWPVIESRRDARGHFGVGMGAAQPRLNF